MPCLPELHALLHTAFRPRLKTAHLSSKIVLSVIFYLKESSVTENFTNVVVRLRCCFWSASLLQKALVVSPSTFNSGLQLTRFQKTPETKSTRENKQ